MFIKFKKYTLIFSLSTFIIYSLIFFAPKLIDKLYENLVDYPFRAFIWGSVKYSYYVNEKLHLNYIKLNIDNSFPSNKRYAYSREIFMRNFDSYDKNSFGNYLYEIADSIYKNNDRDIDAFKKKIILSKHLNKDIENNLNLLYQLWKKYPLTIELSELFFQNYIFTNKTECLSYLNSSFFANPIDTIIITKDSSVTKLLNFENSDKFFDHETLQTKRKKNNSYSYIIENSYNTHPLRIDFLSSNKYLSNFIINRSSLNTIAEVLHSKNIIFNNGNIEIIDLMEHSFIIIKLNQEINSEFFNISYIGDNLLDQKKKLYCD